MSRYTGPITRLNRRFGQPLFAINKSYERKPYPPGMHGARLRRKITDYGTSLAEKQKLRFKYGLTEKQFRNTFVIAKKRQGVTGEIFLQLLEFRLDNIIYRSGFASSRQSARQFVNHGHVLIKNRKVNIPSYNCDPGVEVEVNPRTSSKQLAVRNLAESQHRIIPTWLTVEESNLRININRKPLRNEMDKSINDQLIVEFYSR